MPFLELKNASKSFGKGDAATHVLRDVNLSIRDGEFVAIVGYSGTGKSTLINLLAGLVRVDTGAATFEDKPIEGPGPERGLVFQNYSLLPWLSVADNVRLAIDQVHTKSSNAHRQHLVEKYIAMVNLSHAVSKLPHELSGGMRQRVSVARALAMNPQVLLLDEPLSALDALTRATIQDEIANIWQRDRKTVVLITNDVDEGILLADRIVPLLPGKAGATLGESVPVDIERPRDRKAMNHCPDFKRIRKQVFDLLLGANPSKPTQKEAEHVVNAA